MSRIVRLHLILDLDFIDAPDLQVILVVENDFFAIHFRERDSRFL